MRKLIISVSMLLIALGLLGCSFFYSIFPTPTEIQTPAATAIQTPEATAILVPDATKIPTPNPTAIPTQPAQGLPQLTGNWHISMAQTGGIAGVSRMLEISSSGEMTITDERSNKKNTTQLSADKFAMLKKLVASTEYRPITQPMGCADCFIFNLHIENGSEKFQVQLDQVNLPNSGLEPLVGFLGELLNSK